MYRITRTMSLVWVKSSTQCTHTRSLNFKTSSLSITTSLASSCNTMCRIELCFLSSNFFLLSLSRKYLASTQTKNPHFSITSSLIKLLTRVLTSQAYWHLETSKWTKFPMVPSSLQRASTTILYFLGWYIIVVSHFFCKSIHLLFLKFNSFEWTRIVN